MPFLAPGPSASTWSAISFPSRSTQDTPSVKGSNDCSLRTLIHARVTAATVSRVNKTAVNRIWKSLFMGRYGDGAVGRRPRADASRSGICNSGATPGSRRGRLTPTECSTFKIIDYIHTVEYDFWNCFCGYRYCLTNEVFRQGTRTGC